jgi:hypothetical protein
VTWASSDKSVATISNAANTIGVATGVGTGTSTISAALGGVTGTTVLTVTPAVLEMIMVSPTNPSVTKGQTEPFMAMGMYSDNSTQDLTTQVTWASSDTAVATISNASGSEGLASAVGAGTSKITAKLGGMTGETTLTVTLPVLSPVAVKDNGQGGYYEYGTWTTAAGGYNGTYAVANPTTSSKASNRWNLTVPAGTYDVYATWVAAGTDATNTGYSIYDGFKKLGVVSENQQLAPGDGQYGGVAWAKLGTYSVTNGKITIAQSASGANGYIVADGILLVPTVQTGGSAPGGMPPSGSGPMGPMGPGATSGPNSGAGAATTTTSGSTRVSMSDPGGSTAGVTPIAVKYQDDSTSAETTSPAGTHTALSLIDHAIGEVAMGHPQGHHRGLIKHLARGRSAHGRPSIRHHPRE